MTHPANLGPAGKIVWDMARANWWEGPAELPFDEVSAAACQQMLAAIRAMPTGHISIGGISYGGGAAVFASQAEADLRAAGVL